MNINYLLSQLNEAQYKAATVIYGDYLVAAGAGTGKTKVLTTRYVYLIHIGKSPYNICAFTFTKKAANEMLQRIRKVLGYDFEGTICTMHSFCYGYLIEEASRLGFTNVPNIIDETDSLKILRNIIKKYNLEISENEVAKEISQIKNHQRLENRSLYRSMLINGIFYEYQSKLMESNLMDFDDLLYYFHKSLIEDSIFREYIQERYEFIMVDEAQDINKIQYEIINIMNEKNHNLFMVGDQDQCIYSFRGSDINNLNDFINTGALVLKLEENYRCGIQTLNAANKLISKNKNRIDKVLFTNRNENNNDIIYKEVSSVYDEPKYAIKLINRLLRKGYKRNDIAILYRNNSQVYPFENELTTNQIPYRIVGGKPFYSNSEIKVLISYYRFLNNFNDNISFEAIINTPNRGIGNVTFLKIDKLAKEKKISLYEASKLIDEDSLRGFHALIDDLNDKFNELAASKFHKYLVTKLDYELYVLENFTSKRRMDRIREFDNLISNVSSELPAKQTIINFINQLFIDNEIEKNDNNDKINLLTIHQAKGLEFKVVIVAGCVDGIISPKTNNIKDMNEARNLMYVAMTRAEDYLILLGYTSTFKNGKQVGCIMSPFIVESGVLFNNP